MRSTPTAEEITGYREQGFLVVPDFLDAGELARWRTIVDNALERRQDERFPGLAEDPELNTADLDYRYYTKIFTQRVNLWMTDPGIKELMLDQRLGQFMGALAGVGLRLYHDQALVKEPYGNPTSFHLDVPYWSFTSPDALSIWVALDDATVSNGCLYYVAGSHKAQKFDNVAIGREVGALFDVYPEWRDVPAVPCPVPAGGALIHNGLTFHGAGANMTPGRRRAMTCGFMPDGSTFNGQANIYPPDYLERLKVGDVLDDDGRNPLVWTPAATSA